MKIDWWTLAFQLVNVLILVALLARFFFRPVAEIVAKRKAEIAAALAAADAAQKQADALKEKRDAALADVGREREHLIAAAEADAGARKAAILAAAGDEVAALRRNADAAIGREREVAQHALTDHAADLAVSIAERLLTRVPPERIALAFLDGLVTELAALPEERRAVLSAAERLEVASAAALPAADEAAVRARLAAALGAGPALEFRTDPALIAGLELRAAGLVVRNNWGADLDVIRKEVSGADTH